MNEVTEWAEHAQLLPDAVVEKFAANKITGYDFPELVQNDGIMLKEELDITRRGLQNRVLRSMRLLLLGVDEKPDPVQNATVTALSSSRIRIDWQAKVQDKLTFPVHKYVVQRSTSNLLAFLHMSRASLKAAVSWQTICEGLDTSCEDWIPAGFTSSSAPLVEYRITAWNALRRSERVTIDVNVTDLFHDFSRGSYQFMSFFPASLRIWIAPRNFGVFLAVIIVIVSVIFLYLVGKMTGDYY